MAYVIKLERRASPKDEPITMWLSSAAPVVRWGPQENAMRFPDRGRSTQDSCVAQDHESWQITEA